MIYLVSSYLTDVNKAFEIIELSDDDEEPEANHQNATTSSNPPDPKVNLPITVMDKTPNATVGSNPGPKVDHQNTAMVNNQNAPTGTHQDAMLDGFQQVWYYSDPQGDRQGPFSLHILKRWNDGNYFPPEFTIWRYLSNGVPDSVLLVDALKRTTYPCHVSLHPISHHPF